MATVYTDNSSLEFMDKLLNGNVDELNELKAFLFKESIRLEIEKKEIQDLKDKVIEDRARLRKESDEVNNQIVRERRRLKDEELFFDKKMKILKNGFESLEADRKALKEARKSFEYERQYYSQYNKKQSNDDVVLCLFKGVNSYLSLKKRYKDLLKIFHPDNMNGDHEMIFSINKVYEELKREYEGSKII